MTRSGATKLRLIPAEVKDGKPVVSIEVPHARGRSFTAGQWVFVCVPALGALHWHPFTIASSSNDADMRVAVACTGNWTGKLADLAARQDTAKVTPLLHHTRPSPSHTLYRASAAHDCSASIGIVR